MFGSKVEISEQASIIAAGERACVKALVRSARTSVAVENILG